MDLTIPDYGLAHAKDLHRLGHPLFCVPQQPERWPRWKGATVDGNVQRMNAREPTDALAAALGGPLAVVDTDPRNGGDSGLVERLLAVCEAPIVAVVDTGRGGTHHYVWTGDEPLRTRKNIMYGVDLVAGGGACFIPGGAPRDKHEGRRYEVQWSALKLPTDDLDSTGFREWLEWIKPPVREQPVSTHSIPPMNPSRGIRNPKRYIEVAIPNAARQIMEAPRGSRNDVIHRTAHGLGGVLAHLRADPATIRLAEQTLIDAARQVGHRSAEVRSSFSEGLRNPYVPNRGR